MKFTRSALLATATATLVSAQATYNSTSNTWYCPIANGSYCAGDSLSGSTIILCSNYVGSPGDCSGHIQSSPPIDVYDAACWQISSSAGNATCSKNCTVFPDAADPYSVPGNCNYSMASTGSNVAGYGLNSTQTNGTNGTASTGLPSATVSGSASSTGASSTASATPKSSSNAAPLPVSLYTTGSSIFGLALAVAVVL